MSPSVQEPSVQDAAPAAPGTQQGLADPKPSGVAELLSESRFSDAALLFDRTYPWETVQIAPELRYQRARIAEELSDWTRAVQWLEDLEKALPVFRDEIETLRARAQAQVGPFTEAAVKLKASAVHADRVLAVQSLLKAEQPDEAIKLTAALLKRLSQARDSKVEQAELRRIRADTFRAQGKKSEALVDLRWLTLEVPETPAAVGADEAYEVLSGQPLTKLQRYARAEKFTEARDVKAAESELHKLLSAPGTAPPDADVLRTRAWAYYNSRADYQKSAELFQQAAELDPRHRAQDLFYAARARSRANQDEAAIVQYQQLAKRFPASAYAEQAFYQAARLHYLLGQWKKAETAFAAYSARYTTKKRAGRYEDTIAYERSVTRLAMGRGPAAVPDLQRLLAKEQRELERAALRELLGLAWIQAGKHDRAAAELNQVIQERPLSFAALLAEARLHEIKHPPARKLPAREGMPAPVPLTLRLPPKVALLANLGLHEDAEDELARISEEFSKSYGQEGGRALCEAYGQLATAKQRYRHAVRTVKESVLHEELGPDTRWAWSCIYPEPYIESVRRFESTQGIPANLVHALMRQESAFQAGVSSPVGATGLMQLMPATAQRVALEIGVTLAPDELKIPATNIRLGTHYLGKLLKRFDGHVPAAVAAYNAGPGAVDRWLSGARGLGLDLFVARIPYDETRGYVRRVVGNWARYRYLSAGLPAVPNLTLELPAKVEQDVVNY